MKHAPTPARYRLNRSGATLEVELGGGWSSSGGRPGWREFERSLQGEDGLSSVAFSMPDEVAWDSTLLTFLTASMRAVRRAGLEIELAGIPGAVRDLVTLSEAVPVEEPEPERKVSMIEELGNEVASAYREGMSFLDFFGRFLLELGELFRGRIRIRRDDFLGLLQSCGPQALPIVSLMNFLTGLIIAFIGVIQLQRFAADVFVADLVALSTTRELGAVITGVIMAGRTGAAFAAQIGSMQVNEEIDALTSFGISPMRFLVVPRVLALVLMMPLLVAFANFVAISAGLVVAMGVSDVGYLQYREQVREAVDLSDLFLGISKGGVFGVIIGLAGCYRGLNCGRDAAAVGVATTSAVVIAITWITIANAVFAVLCNLLGI